MKLRLLVAILMLLALPAIAAEVQRVPAAEIVAVARTMLERKAADDQVAATFGLVGRVADVSVLGTVRVSLEVPQLKATWLRQRVGVPVLVKTEASRATSVTVWFSVTAPVQANVYATAYPGGTASSHVGLRMGSVDLARTHGNGAASADHLGGMRLRRAVTAGAAALMNDFEPAPAVQVQQVVRIDSNTGALRLSTKGRALTDGAIGEVISVLPANAATAVRARVVSEQVVTVENR